MEVQVEGGEDRLVPGTPDASLSHVCFSASGGWPLLLLNYVFIIYTRVQAELEPGHPHWKRFLIFFFTFKDFIYLFLERGEGREKGGEKH